jgi:hypothetical protein
VLDSAVMGWRKAFREFFLVRCNIDGVFSRVCHPHSHANMSGRLRAATPATCPRLYVARLAAKEPRPAGLDVDGAATVERCARPRHVGHGLVIGAPRLGRDFAPHVTAFIVEELHERVFRQHGVGRRGFFAAIAAGSNRSADKLGRNARRFEVRRSRRSTRWPSWNECRPRARRKTCCQICCQFR